MDRIEEYTAPAIQKMASQEDDLVRRAVVEVIGKAWLPSDVKNRCRFERIIGETWQTLIIDGEPVLMLFDVEFPAPELRNDAWVVSMSQRYKYVGRAAHLNGLPVNGTGEL